MLSTAIDVGQRQCPWGTAQLFGTALGDAGGVADRQRLLLFLGLLQILFLKLDGHTVDPCHVEDFSNFFTGVLISPVLLILDVQGGDDLPTDEFPDVHFMNTADSRHGRELTH